MQLNIGKIEEPVWYVDKAFRKARKKLDLTKISNRSLKTEEKSRILENKRLAVSRDVLVSDLQRLIDAFPKYKLLDDFYKEMFSCIIDVDMYKKALASLKWAIGRVDSFFKQYTSMISKAKTYSEIIKTRNMFLARTTSIMKQLSDNYLFLDDTRKKLADLPKIKPDMFTVAIAGFPNVGKSTLLGKITTSKPEVNSYAFTTKGIMIGYLRHEDKKIQIIDTPGTLNRLDKMNNIERMAHIALSEVTDFVIYVFDFTEPYSLSKQIELYQNIKQLGKKIIVYFSKSDIVNTKIIDEFEFKGTYNPEEVRKIIIEEAKENEDV